MHKIYRVDLCNQMQFNKDKNKLRASYFGIEGTYEISHPKILKSDYNNMFIHSANI